MRQELTTNEKKILGFAYNSGLLFDDIVKFWQPEFFHIILPMIDSARIGKYKDNQYLEDNPIEAKCEHKANTASLFRHVAETYTREDPNKLTKDKDSGLDPYLHTAIRSMMPYTRLKRGLKMLGGNK